MKAQRYSGTLTAVEEILGTGHLDSSGTSGHDRSWIGNVDDGSEGVALVSGVGSSMYWEITRGHLKGLPVVCVDMRGMPGYPSQMCTDDRDTCGTGLRSQGDIIGTCSNINVYNEALTMKGRKVKARANKK